MALTPEEREAARIRKADQRAREKFAKERAQGFVAPIEEEDAEKTLEEHGKNLEWAQELDATGVRYKSECRPLIDLLAIYEGADILDKESDDEDEEDNKKKKKSIKEKKYFRKSKYLVYLYYYPSYPSYSP